MEYKDRNLCKICLTAIVWAKNSPKGDKVSDTLCPICEVPIFKYNIPGELFIQCEYCGVILMDEDTGFQLLAS